MYMTQKPKFPYHRNQMNTFINKFCVKNYFPRFFGFFPATSHIRKSAKMWLLENRSKMLQLHQIRKSSKMIVRGWYIPHFERRDLLHSKKQVWGGFCNLSDLPGLICDFSRFFRKFRPGSRIPKIRFFWLPSPKKMFEMHFFSKVLIFPKTMLL